MACCYGWSFCKLSLIVFESYCFLASNRWRWPYMHNNGRANSDQEFPLDENFHYFLSSECGAFVSRDKEFIRVHTSPGKRDPIKVPVEEWKWMQLARWLLINRFIDTSCAQFCFFVISFSCYWPRRLKKKEREKYRNESSCWWCKERRFQRTWDNLDLSHTSPNGVQGPSP